MNTLEQNIMDALADSRRLGPYEISVQAFGGDVTLTGTVESVVEREAAVRTTRHVAGVRSVTNRLRLRDTDACDCAAPEAAVLDALDADAAVRVSDIDVAVTASVTAVRVEIREAR